MSVPPRLQLLLDALGEKVKRAGESEPHEASLPASSCPSRATSGTAYFLQPPLQPRKAVSAPLRPNPDWLPAPQRVVTAQSLVEELTVPLKTEVHPTALRIYQTLSRLALEVAKSQGYSPSVTQVTFHVPTEVLAFNVGKSRKTVWLHAKTLIAKGLIDRRPHKTTLNGKTRNDGTLWAVKLTPLKGKRARLSYEDLKHSYRDLEADIRKGRTAFKTVKQSKKPKDQQEVINNLLSWALPHKNHESPLNMTVACAPEAIFDLPFATKGEKGEMVDKVATGICHHLGDNNSLNFYRRLLWQLLRLHDRHQNYFAAVHNAIIRAGVDKREGFARKAGALFVSRLKESGLWDLLQSTPANPVGARPLAA